MGAGVVRGRTESQLDPVLLALSNWIHVEAPDLRKRAALLHFQSCVVFRRYAATVGIDGDVELDGAELVRLERHSVVGVASPNVEIGRRDDRRPGFKNRGHGRQSTSLARGVFGILHDECVSRRPGGSAGGAGGAALGIGRIMNGVMNVIVKLHVEVEAGIERAPLLQLPSLGTLGLTNFPWLSYAWPARTVVILALVWTSFGF